MKEEYVKCNAGFDCRDCGVFSMCMEKPPCVFPPAAPVPQFSSVDLLLLANDEWKRREERKHNHENAPWCAGFINGFLTDKKWAKEYVDKLRQPKGGEQP